jgi:hypothetical protein
MKSSTEKKSLYLNVASQQNRLSLVVSENTPTESELGSTMHRVYPTHLRSLTGTAAESYTAALMQSLLQTAPCSKRSHPAMMMRRQPVEHQVLRIRT